MVTTGPSAPNSQREPKQAPVEITGVWLRDGNDDHDLAVLVEVDGEWRLVIATQHSPGALLSHIVEPLGIRMAPRIKRESL